jgi:formylglycine-generating enzyme required for sulfatase activity
MTENTSSPSQKGRIFISYRRIDSAGYAGRIYDRLVANFGEEAIFMDVDTIEGGTDFVKVLEDAVQSCDVLIALIGRQWLSIKDKDGKRRLDSPEDFVRIEIATALKRNIRVIPVLVDSVDMPQPSELPENLKALARRNALQVNHHSFNPDVYRLIEHTKSALDEAEESREMKAKALQAAREEAAREKAKRDAVEKAQLEAEELARQEAIKEKVAREAAEKEKRENAKRQIARKTMVNETLLKILPFLRTLGMIGIIVFLLWGGSLAISKFVALIPTARVSGIPSTNTKIVVTKTLVSPTKTVRPNATSTNVRTPVPTTFPSEIKDAKGVPMVLVPDGKFVMGTSNEDYTYYLDVDQNPAHNVFLDAFYIDKYEVTNSLYKICVDAGICTKPYNRSSNNRPQYYGNSEFDDYPVIYVDWYQAKAYCEWRGARLPTEAEWEKAARGTDERYYSWAGNVNGGANTTGATVWTGDTTKVGKYALGKSPYGAYDMTGNVWEWVNDWYKSDYYSTLGGNAINPQGPSEGDSKVLRGGSWTPCWRVGGGGCVEGSASTFNRHRDYPSRFYYDVGFRCAKDAP